MNDKTKVTTFGAEAHRYIAEAIEIMGTAVGSTYGPGGRPMLIRKQYVDPMLSTDGVTVARNIAGHGSRLKDPRVSDAAKNIYQASEKTNKTAGDGTTATVVLLGELYRSGYKQIAAGVDAMHIKRKIDSARTIISKFIEDTAVECDKEKLVQVATISGKDEALGNLIADLVWEVGADGTVNIEYQNAPNIEVEKVTGYLFNQGFKHLMGVVEYENPLVFVTQKRMASKSDIIPLLELAATTQKQFLIIGDVTGAALETLVWALQNQKADGLVVPPPAFGADGHEYFEDIATYTGARLWLESDSFAELSSIQTTDQLEQLFGTVKKARISRDKAVLFGDNSTGDAIVERIRLIKEQLNGDVSTSQKEALDERLAKLAGKVSVIKVGAATELEREELFFRVEDAVEACKSALSSGVVAGGATTLLFASQLDELEPFVKEALREPFKLLMKNAAERADYRLEQIIRSGYGSGFNLSDMTN